MEIVFLFVIARELICELHIYCVNGWHWFKQCDWINFTLDNKTVSFEETNLFTLTWQTNKCKLLKYALSYIDIHPHVLVACASNISVHGKYTDKI